MALAITESSPTENETPKQLEGSVPRLQPDGVLSPRRVLTRHLLAEAVREALDDCSHTRCELSGVGARIVVRVGRELAGLVFVGTSSTGRALSRTPLERVEMAVAMANRIMEIRDANAARSTG